MFYGLPWDVHPPSKEGESPSTKIPFHSTDILSEYILYTDFICVLPCAFYNLMHNNFSELNHIYTRCLLNPGVFGIHLRKKRGTLSLLSVRKLSAGKKKFQGARRGPLSLF